MSYVCEDSMLLRNTTDELPGNNSDTGLCDVERVLVPILDALILTLGVAGHSVVMVILCGRRRRGSPLTGQAAQHSTTGTGTDVLILALSAADLLLLTILPFHTITIALQHWPFGNALCRLVGFLGSACSSASSFTLAMLAVSRYLTVVRPTTAYRLLSPRRVSAVAVALWVPACCLAAPQLAFRFVGAQHQTHDGHACFSLLSHTDQLIYGLFHFLVAFLFPLVTIALAYMRIYMFLWGSRRATQMPQVERYQSKVTHTSAMLVLAFTLCWLPSYGLTLALLAEKVSGATSSSSRYGAFTVFARLMATSSTVINPILYVLMSQKFRKDLIRVFRKKRKNGSAEVAT